jgi:methylmalonyl-CoA mutase
MTKAIEKGIPKMRIEEAAAKKQAKIDSGQDIIVGVNKFQLKEEDPLQILNVDNEAVRRSQIDRLSNLKKNRNSKKVKEILTEITKNAKLNLQSNNPKSLKKKNLLHLAIKAAKERATLGEISDALEVAFGRHKAVHKTISGVYSKEIKNNKLFKEAIELIDKFAELEGRRPRIMIAKLGQDGHDRGAKVVATAYADLGFDVDIGPLFQTPKEAVKQAIENDVHILGISSLAAGHKTLVPQVISELKKYEREDIMVIVGGVIPAQDYQFLFDCGALGVFGPGTKIAQAALDMITILIDSVK